MHISSSYLKAARGDKKASRVLKGGRVMNVFTNELIKADVAIEDGMIVGIGSYDGIEEIDCTGKYIAPAFIDAHIHIESTLAAPETVALPLLQTGTATIIADPHEMVNVSGRQALDYLLEATEHIPLNVYVMMPSSVPATEFETNGAGAFLAEDMKSYVNHPRVLGLGEVMCFDKVIDGDRQTLCKLELFKKDAIDGHAPGVSEKRLMAYRLAGIENDHECSTFEEALEKLRAGFHIYIREGSGAKNLEALVRGFLDAGVSFDRCAFCSDDRHLKDIRESGHMNYAVRKAIELGVPVVTAYKMAGLHTAGFYGLKHLGAAAPGYEADLMILDDLESVQPKRVLYKGKFTEEICSRPVNSVKPDKALLDTVHFKDIVPEQLFVPRGEKNDGIEMIAGQLVTKHFCEPVPGTGGQFVPDSVYNKICVVERHGKNGLVSAAPLKGFCIKGGAIATTVSHDAHNVIAAGDNDRDICLAVNYLKTIHGGYVLASNGRIEGCLPLPLFGLMSLEAPAEIEQKAGWLIEKAHFMGVLGGIDPFITLSFMALSVIPEIRITEKGLISISDCVKLLNRYVR